MPFTSISSGEIEVGDALKKELFDKIKSNEDDLDSRVSDIEDGARKVEVFKTLVLNAASANSVTGLMYYTADDDFTLTSASIRIFEKGTLTGSLEIDVKKSSSGLANSSFASVFTTKPKLTLAGVSNYATSVNQVFNNGMTSIVAGDTLRFDITELPSGGVLGKFILNVYGEKS